MKKDVREDYDVPKNGENLDKLPKDLLNTSKYLDGRFPICNLRVRVNDGQYLFINSNVEEMFGYDQKSIYDTPLFVRTIIPPDYVDEFDNLWKKVSDGIIPDEYDFPVIDKKGHIRWIRQYNSLRYDENGNPSEIDALIMDITEHKLLENELDDTARKYRELFSSSRDGIVIVDNKGRFVDANPAYCKMLGYTLDELRKLDSFDEITPKKWHEWEWEEIWNKKLLTEGFSGVYEKEYIHKSGRVFPVELQSFTTFDENHEPKYLWGVVREITERKKSQQALLDQTRLTAVGELAAGVAHDFNNALQSILGNVDLAMLDRTVDDELHQYLETIKQSALDAATRVRKLQKFARNSKSDKHFKPLDINVLVLSVLDQTKYLWKDSLEKDGKRIIIEKQLESDRKIWGNKGNLRSVFFNIIKNGFEAMPTGGFLKIKTTSNNKINCIEISDTGIGMDKMTRDRIFQPFFSTKGYEQGRGLGMSQSFGIIREHRGTIKIKETAPGKGTTIQVKLPNSEVDYTDDEQNESDVDRFSGRVLWVDDERPIRIFATNLFKKFNISANVVENGRKALELMSNNIYDVIITDLGMPDLNGWQLAEIIRKKDRNMQIAIVTGWDISPNSQKIEKLDISRVLHKPLEVSEVLAYLKELEEEKTKKLLE